MTSRAYGARGARSPRSHCDVIVIVTSFTTELATPTITDVRTDTLPRLIYKDDEGCVGTTYADKFDVTVVWGALLCAVICCQSQTAGDTFVKVISVDIYCHKFCYVWCLLKVSKSISGSQRQKSKHHLLAVFRLMFWSFALL